MASEKTLYAYIAEFDNVEAVVTAASKVRDAGFTRWDTHTPFPVHGMDEAMGIRRTVLPWFSLFFGLCGMAGGLLLQWYTNAYDYPFLISGKPFFSLPANIPIVFELTVLITAIPTVMIVMLLNGLPQLYHPVFNSERFKAATDDKFFIVIEANDPKFDERQTPEFLQSLGGTAVEKIEE